MNNEKIRFLYLQIFKLYLFELCIIYPLSFFIDNSHNHSTSFHIIKIAIIRIQSSSSTRCRAFRLPPNLRFLNVFGIVTSSLAKLVTVFSLKTLGGGSISVVTGT